MPFSYGVVPIKHTYLITVNTQWSFWVTVTGFTALVLSHIPVPWGWSITAKPYHIGQTWTLACHSVTFTSTVVCAHWMANTCYKTRTKERCINEQTNNLQNELTLSSTNHNFSSLFLFFEENKMTFHVNHLPSRWLTWNAKPYFLLKIITQKQT